jgi:hypothetical protein
MVSAARKDFHISRGIFYLVLLLQECLEVKPQSIKSFDFDSVVSTILKEVFPGRPHHNIIRLMGTQKEV